MFKEIDIKELSMNPFTKIGDEWSLLTAGNKENGFNMMTASWAGFGMFWNRNVVTVYVRESRFTKRFFDANDLFTVSFYDETYRKALNKCGYLHGNECDKVKESGLTPYFFDGTTAFEEANLIFCCRKLYHAALAKNNVDSPEAFAGAYPDGDLHTIYIGEVIKVLGK
jgi:flavin reductase (DIM6/NTAB) family NADH-FMN oxidoreductase RutF